MEGSYYPGHRREMPVRQVSDRMEPVLFTPVGPPLRKLVVMVDAALVTGPHSPEAAGAVLEWLLGHPFIQCYRYLDSGRPPQLGGASSAAPRGWVVIEEDELRYWDGTRVVTKFLNGSFESETAGLEVRDRRAALVAALVGADFFITERDQLLGAKGWMRQYLHFPASEPPCYRVRDGLALVGLYLRAQGEYMLGADTSDTFGHTAKKQFLWRAARTILPAIWRWNYALQHVPDGHPQSGISPHILANSLGHRIELALDERDAVHVALNQPDDAYAANEVFRRLDNCLVLLMGAYDAAAAVAHLLLIRRVGERDAAGGMAATVVAGDPGGGLSSAGIVGRRRDLRT